MLRVADDSNLPTIRVPFGVGIAGTVADTGDVCNIHDADIDPLPILEPTKNRATRRRTFCARRSGTIRTKLWASSK